MSDDVHEDEPSGEVAEPRSDDLLGELPWAEPEPDDLQPFEDLVAARRRRRSRWTTAGIALAGVGLLALVSVAWLSGSDEPTADPVPSSIAPAPGPTTTTTTPDTSPPFEVTALDDGWYRVTADDGSMTADLPAEPHVRGAAAAGLVYLVADLPGGGLAELLWAPQQAGAPATLAPYLAMVGTAERYKGVRSEPPREVDGAVVIEGGRITERDVLSARSVARDRAVALVVLVVPADADPAIADATWDRMVGSLEISG